MSHFDSFGGHGYKWSMAATQAGPIPGFDPAKKLGMPGEPPYTRGIYPTMYAGRLWTMRQYAGYGDAAESNQRYRYLLRQGQTGLSIAFDLPTQMGFDPDHDLARGEVGRTGVSVASVRDMAAVFDGIPLDRVTVSMTINATAHILLSFLITAAERQGVAASRLGGTVQNDILKEFVARGCYIYPPGPSMKIATDIMEYCIRNVPRWNYISVSGYHIREAGSTAAQELGFTLSNAIEYVQHGLARGLDAASIGRRMSFFFNVHNNFFEEIAKFRAARRLWCRILEERFGVRDPAARRLRFHAQTAGSTLTSRQPENNLVRVTLQALAAVLGGAQSIHTNAYDEALALPSERAATLALRTQQIIAYETGIPDVVDAFGGSFHLERETDRLEAEAMRIIEKVDELGGAVRAIQCGFVQREIERSALEDHRAIEEGRRKIVGVNVHTEEEDGRKVDLLKIDPRLEERRHRELKALRATRDGAAARRALDRLQRVREQGGNLMPALLQCARAEVTLGEISEALADGYGRYRPENARE